MRQFEQQPSAHQENTSSFSNSVFHSVTKKSSVSMDEEISKCFSYDSKSSLEENFHKLMSNVGTPMKSDPRGAIETMKKVMEEQEFKIQRKLINIDDDQEAQAEGMSHNEPQNNCLFGSTASNQQPTFTKKKSSSLSTNSKKAPKPKQQQFQGQTIQQRANNWQLESRQALQQIHHQSNTEHRFHPILENKIQQIDEIFDQIWIGDDHSLSRKNDDKIERLAFESQAERVLFKGSMELEVMDIEGLADQSCSQKGETTLYKAESWFDDDV